MVSQIYNRVAESYDEDWSGIYAAARRYCLDQITNQLESLDHPVNTVDLGIGTGNSLSDLRNSIVLGKCTGFDLSSGMLDQAAQKLGKDVQLILGDATNAPAYLQPGSVDLALCHFLLSFVDAGKLFQVVYDLLKPGGVISLATSTQRSLHELHSGKLRRTAQLLGVPRALRKISIPANHQHCLEMLQRQGFEIVNEHLHRQPVSFKSFNDLHDWALNSGWVAGSFDNFTRLRIACCSTVFALAKVFIHPLYPINAINEVSIVLARKPAIEDAHVDHDVRPDNRTVHLTSAAAEEVTGQSVANPR